MSSEMQPGHDSGYKPAHLISKNVENQGAPTRAEPAERRCVAMHPPAKKRS